MRREKIASELLVFNGSFFTPSFPTPVPQMRGRGGGGGDIGVGFSLGRSGPRLRKGFSVVQSVVSVRRIYIGVYLMSGLRALLLHEKPQGRKYFYGVGQGFFFILFFS